nr:type III secretion system translocon subunit SctE [uncultured Enterobacter sp.]
MNGITNNPLPISAYTLDDYKQQVSVAAKTEATKLNNDQMDAARKIIESKVITQFDKSQNNGDTLKPTLRAPVNTAMTGETASAEKKSSMETYNDLMAKMIVLLGDQSIDDLKARAEMYTKISKENGSASADVLAQVDAEEQAYDNAKSADMAAKQSVDHAQQQLTALTRQLQSLQQSKAELERKISDAKTPSADIAGLKSQLASVNSQISQTQAAINTQQAVLNNAQQTQKATGDAVSTSAQELDGSLKYLDTLNKHAATVNTALQQSMKSSAGTAALLMAQMIAIMGEATEETMKSNIAFAQKTQEAQQLKLASDAEEVEKQQEKSKHMQDTMGCVGKIIGAIVMVVSVVSAVFTGGASLAFAAVGIAIMAADQIYQKVTGNESFIAAALKPIMEHVLMPIIQAITDAISSVLKAFGVKNEVAEIIASVLAVVVLIVSAIAVSVIAKQLPIDKLMNAIGGMIKNVLNAVLSTLAKALKPLVTGAKSLADDLAKMMSKLNSTLTKFLNQIFGDSAKSKVNVLKEFFDDEVNIKNLGNRVNFAEDALKFSAAGIDSAGNITAGTFEKRVSEIMADITRTMSASASMKLFTDGVMDEYRRSMENMNSMMTSAADMAGEEQAVGRFIFAHTRA